MTGSIQVRGLSRTFRTTVRRPGFAGALRSLVNPERVAKHAVCDISFDVAPGELLALLGVAAYLGARLLWRWSLGHYTGVNG